MATSKENNEQLLVDLHKQFAENANSNQALFLKLFIALFAIFTALGFVFIHTAYNSEEYLFLYRIKAEDNYMFSLSTLFLISTLTIIVLSFLKIMLISLGWGFRTEQKVNNSIRKLFLDKPIFSATKLRSINIYQNIFIKYNYGTDKTIKDMPGFYENFSLILSILKFLIVTVLCLKCPIVLDSDSITLWATLIISACIEHWYYYNKVQKIATGKRPFTDRFLHCPFVHLVASFFIIFLTFYIPLLQNEAKIVTKTENPISVTTKLCPIQKCFLIDYQKKGEENSTLLFIPYPSRLPLKREIISKIDMNLCINFEAFTNTRCYFETISK